MESSFTPGKSVRKEGALGERSIERAADDELRRCRRRLKPLEGACLVMLGALTDSPKTGTWLNGAIRRYGSAIGGLDVEEFARWARRQRDWTVISLMFGARRGWRLAQAEQLPLVEAARRVGLIAKRRS